MDNKRSYGTVLIGKTKPEDRAPSPCIRYFIDKDGRRITEPEEYIPPENAGWIEPDEYLSKEMGEEFVTKYKPPAEQLRADQLVMHKLQAAEKYGCTKSTIERWTREYQLPHWKQTWEWRAETQNKAVMPLGDTLTIDSSSGDNSNDSEPNMEVQEVVRLETMPVEPEVLEELRKEKLLAEEISTLDDIPFGEEPTDEVEQILDELELNLINEQLVTPAETFNPLFTPDLSAHLADDSDEDIWQHIENHVQALYSLKLNRLNGDFKSRLRKLMEGVNV